MSTPESVNYILYLQEVIRTECKTIIEEQRENTAQEYIDRQTVLNKLYTQYMELGLKATRLIAASINPVSVSSTEDTEEGVELSARTLSVETEEGVELSARTLSVAEDGCLCRTKSAEPSVDN